MKRPRNPDPVKRRPPSPAASIWRNRPSICSISSSHPTSLPTLLTHLALQSCQQRVSRVQVWQGKFERAGTLHPGSGGGVGGLGCCAQARPCAVSTITIETATVESRVMRCATRRELRATRELDSQNCERDQEPHPGSPPGRTDNHNLSDQVRPCMSWGTAWELYRGRDATAKAGSNNGRQAGETV